MAYEKLGGETLNYQPCHYAGSKLLFRGPKRSLDSDYIAFLGGTETYGKFIPNPFVNLVEAELSMPCVNLGWSNAGVDVFLHDKGIIQTAQAASAVVLQLPCAQNMTNRFYTVHPRRNDRFVKPLALMQQVFPEVDFSEFHFTRHLLGHLQRRAPDRFATLLRELQITWVARMKLLISEIDRDVILLWFSKRRPGEDYDSPEIHLDPALVSRNMVEALRGCVAEIVEVFESPAAAAVGTTGMTCSTVELPAARELLGPVAHQDAADALVPVLRTRLNRKRPARKGRPDLV